jgi:hypothetical protein
MDVEPEKASSVIEAEVKQITNSVQQQVESRAVRAANELRNAAMFVLRGSRSGRQYKVPGTYSRHVDKAGKQTVKYRRMRNGVYYTASAPGEAPANRTGLFRLGWQSRSYMEARVNGGIMHATIENNQKVPDGKLLGEILEKGSKDGRLAPRPYKQAVINRAKPAVDKIYREPYTR